MMQQVLCRKQSWVLWKMQQVLNKKLQGSYTVEASLVMPILLAVIGSTILLGYTIYQEGISYLQEVTPKEMQSVETFRLLQAGEDVVSDLLGE